MTEASEQGAPRKPDLKILGAELENQERAAEAKKPEPEAKQRVPSGVKTAADLGRREVGEIFPGCPVTALGVHGKTFFYLDWLGQLQDEKQHTKDRMRALFGGRSDILQGWFPQYNKSGMVSGWSQEDLATMMMTACTEKGVWNAFEKVRGLGAWPDDQGGIVLHCGDAILYKGTWRQPGEIEGYVYPSSPRIPRPLEEFTGTSHGQVLLDLLSTWSWQREDVDAYLLLGWICAAVFGGALDWRPLVWITGDAGTGKSTLQKLLRHVMGGEGAILQSTDPTEAGIRQFLMQSTIPVALDEMEAEANGQKIQAVVKLARQAASGGVILRGGADHKGQEFKARSAFMFSSINVPPLLDQDVSRIALLELMPLRRGEEPPAIEPRHWMRVGRGLRTRVIDGWPRLHQTLERYRQALARAGHSARGCDQFGTLLAMADLALYDDLPSIERCDLWATKLSASAIEEQTDQSSDWQRCLNFLFAQQLDLYRSGERYTVGRWILIAAGWNTSDEPHKAQRALASVGMRVYGERGSAQLAIANGHDGLARLFEGTHWHAHGAQKGVWAQAMKRVPTSVSTEPIKFDGVLSRARRFSLRAIPNFSEDDEMSQPPQAGATPQIPPDINDF